jgi:RimJ/RimL family protein N-acetyltransferase
MFARTERLLLRPGWREDAPALFAAIAHEPIVRNLAQAPWPYRPEHAEIWLKADRGPADLSALIFLRCDGPPVLVGGVGVHPGPDGAPELGYWIARPFQGRGFATEAGRAVLEAARDGRRLPRLGAGHFLDNPASGRVLEKLGFRATGRIVPRWSAGRGEEVPSRLFELVLREEEEEAVPAMAA